MSDTLLLNHDGSPLSGFPPSIINWQTAVKLVFLEKVIIVKSYDDWAIHSQKLEMPVPSIIMTRRYIKPRYRVRFNRKMIYLRDNYTCQYCGGEFSSNELTLDHVTPKSRGGDRSWHNLVTSCFTCNWLKGADAMEPRVQPKEPTYWHMVKAAKQQGFVLKDPAWAEYLGYNNQTEPLQAVG